MRIRSLVLFGLAGGAMVLLASCAVQKGLDFPLQCQMEVRPQGSYEYAAGVSVPLVRPLANGSASGAAALNTCIRSKAAAAGITTAPVPMSATTRQRYVLETSGSRLTRKYVYGRHSANGRGFFGLFGQGQQSSPSDTSVCRGGLEMRGGAGYYCGNSRTYVGG